MPTGLRITAIVAVYNEADIIGQTVGDLVRQGIHVHVLDNLSTDGTAAELERYAASGLVHVEQFPSGDEGGPARHFEYRRIIRRKQELSLELEADWFIAHDADEIRESPWAHVSLREGIEMVDRGGWNAIDFTVLNFCPIDDRFTPDLNVRETFRYYEPAGPWDLTQVKCWKKARDIDFVTTAGHDARFAARKIFPVRFILRHYPVRSQLHGTRKIFEERMPRFLDEERHQGWHVQYNGIMPGHRFLRDPADLTEFIPDRVRAESLMQDMRNIQTTIDRQHQEAAVLEQQLGHQTAHLNHVSTLLADRDEAVARLETDINHLRVQVNRLQNEILALHASRSWKLTAPVRGAWRVVQRLWNGGGNA